MTGKLRQKLNSRSGVSMVAALVFFLFCVVIGGITLTAATAAAGRIAADRSYQRRYLSVSSAAQLVKEDLSGLSFTGAYLHSEVITTTANLLGYDVTGEPITSSTVTRSESYEKGGEATGFSAGSRLMAESGIELSGIYYSSLDPAVKGLLMPFDNPRQQSCTLAFPGELVSAGSGAQYDLSEVTGRLTVDVDYKMTVELEDSEGDVRLLMTFLPVMMPDVSSQPPSIVAESADTVRQTTVTRYSTVISWSDPIITVEGGAA